MGREVRKVPANWDHPKQDGYPDRLQPMHDKTFEDAAAEWKAEFAAHNPAEHDGLEYWEWNGGPPDREYHRPWKDEDATWFQVWETVSEGTPVTPPFATQDELINYLATRGDFWDQKRGDGPWSRDAAERFVGQGWAPSMIVMNGTISQPRDAGMYDQR